jgi:Leucine-rich repeat (LRR) protein
MKKLLLVLLALPFIGFGQQTYVPDNNFEAYLEAYGMGNGIPNDDYVTTANIITVTYLDVYGQNIADLTGIEAFTALTTLSCGDNQLTSLDVSQNTALTELICGENQLTSLDVSQNTALTFLQCWDNQLSSLNVSQNTALDTLLCADNHLTSLDVQYNTALTVLYCYFNQLTSLNVSANTALTVLNCVSNQLTSLDVSGATALTDLYCINNQLTSLDVSQNTALTTLLCDDNQLTSLNVSQNTALTDLYCINNQLTSLDVSQNTALTTLLCDDNQLTSLNVSQNTALTYLRCDDNLLTSLNVSANLALTYLECHNNQLTSLDVSQNTALTTLYCWANQLTSLDVRNGNNTNFTNFEAQDNPNLYCIDVDDATWSTANWTVANWNIDPQSYFSNNCNPIYGCTDSLACNYDALADTDDGSCVYSNTGTDIISSCAPITWIDGITYNASTNTPTFTIVGGSSAGCDSIVTLDLTINNFVTGTDIISSCAPITWIDGITYNASTNTPTFTIVGGSSAGCDSIVTLDLTINNFVTGTDIISSCAPITWIDGITYNASTNTPTFTFVGGSSAGCDSIVTLDLTINSVVTGTDIISSCAPITWIDGITYNASTNTPTFTIVGGSSAGCDSTVTLDLTINNFVTGTDIISSCAPITWIDGITYNASTNTPTFTIVGGSSAGCDSIVTLDLTITGNPIGQISQFGVTLQVAAFSGVVPYTYTWNTSASTQTITPTANGTYWCVITDANGCVSDTSYYNYSTTAINEINTTKQLLRITDLLGQETPYRRNTTLFYIYNDGTVEKKVVIE